MLPRPVFGFRYPGQDFTIFRNAERHAVGTRLFASYDLKDFFPSVTTNQVVKALRRLPPHSTYRAFSESEKTDFEWASNDLVALLSRLTTHKGRLPQGAPTSPALASLAFVPCDRKIMGAISQHGQLRSTEYTRYGDDLTFSIPLARFASAKEFQAAVNQVLTSSLTGTGFELNPKKTRAGDSRTGFHVTGLLVRNRKIDLPRSQKRRLRQLCHQLRSSSLIDTAHRLRWLKADEQAARWLGRRLRSQVRFFAAAGVDLLRYKCPELSIEDLRATSEDGGPTYPELIQPRKWQIVRRLLCYAWEGRVRARMDAMDCQIEGPDGEPVVLLHGNENLALFTLGGREALMALISWKHCRGLESFLRAAPLSTQTTNFQSFGWWSLRLHEALLATPIFRVAPEPAPSRPQASGAPLVILWEEELRPRIARMVGAYRELCRELGVEPGETSAIERPPERNGLRAWLVTLVDILRSVPRIPRRAEGALKAVIHLADWAGGERHDDYPDLQELLHSCGLQDTSSGPSSIDAIVHRHLVERLYLDLHNLAPVGSEEMVDSPWHLPPGERLRSEVEKLIRLLEELAARDALVCEWHEEDSDHLASLITDSKMEENWRHICRSAHILYLWTIENRAGRPTPGKTNKKLQYIAKLRHRFAHGFMSFTHENLSDWLEAQRVCSRNLERNWKPEADPSTRVRLLEPALDLRLSSIEASELKIRLVAYCVEVLQEELQEIESQGREK